MRIAAGTGLVAVVLAVAAVLVPTSALAGPHDGGSFSGSCGPIRYEVNRAGASVKPVRAIHRAMARVGRSSGREVVFVGYTKQRRSDGIRPQDAPILIEFYWPDSAPAGGGYGEPFVANGQLAGGSVYLHPDFARGGRRVARKVVSLTMHELGHIGGLGHSDDPNAVMHGAAIVRRYTSGEHIAMREAFASPNACSSFSF